jgi:hypothetical protein
MRRPVILAVLVVLLTAGMVFGAAGRIDRLQGWFFLGAHTAIVVAAFLVVDPAVIQERSHLRPGINRRDSSC